MGGRDAMAELVEGTQELAVQDGQGSAGSFVCCSLCLTPSSASQVSSANIILPIDHVVSPKVKLVVFLNEVTQYFLVLARDTMVHHPGQLHPDGLPRVQGGGLPGARGLGQVEQGEGEQHAVGRGAA